MPDADIRMAGTCLGISYLLAVPTVFYATTLSVSLWGLWIWTFGIASPLCVSIGIWAVLVKSKWERERTRYKRLEEGRMVPERSLEEDVRGVWESPCW
ncbi:hypothetical protein GGR53DRAFT_74354 [Hypoxylon sp. FL1150]|nr:hypothetical protein GGR53DRAFT_74354 [Hypoxylon sp. FL1150]